MSKFKITKTKIPNVLVIEPKIFQDERGFFLESYNFRDFEELGIKKTFVQDNQSFSKKGVLRGLHFQTVSPQGKLVRVVIGKVFDVAVDLRRNSPTFGEYFGIILSSDNFKMLYIPEGFAHGFLGLTDVQFQYKVTNYYLPKYDSGLIWNDLDIDIKWPFDEFNIKNPIISSKDRNLPKLSEFETPFIFKKV